MSARGVARQAIFLDDADRQRYLTMLLRVTRRMSWSCLTYCLMGNHVHLLVETPMPNLGRGVQRLHGEYGRAFNERHQRVGHLFQGRFHAESVESDEHLWATVRYVVRNPVEAGLCEAAGDWPWSSHAAILRGEPPACLDQARLFHYLGAYGGNPLDRYSELLKGV